MAWRADGLDGLGRLGFGRGLIEAQLADDGVRAVHHPALDVAGAELGQHRPLQDDAGQRVGEHGLQAIAHLDANLVLRWDDDEDGPVVGGLLADAPGAQELIAVVLDLIAAERRQGDHHQLARGLLLQGRQFRGQGGLDFRGQHMGVIHHPAGQGGELGRRGAGRTLGPGRRREQERQQGQKARQAAHGLAGVVPGMGGGEPGAAPGVASKLTTGADWAEALAENRVIGFSLL